VAAASGSLWRVLVAPVTVTTTPTPEQENDEGYTWDRMAAVKGRSNK